MEVRIKQRSPIPSYSENIKHGVFTSDNGSRMLNQVAVWTHWRIEHSVSTALEEFEKGRLAIVVVKG